jgi:DNA repair exonuclease SbcCD ATPase subunit
MKNFKIQIAIISAVAVGALAMLYVQQQTLKDLRQQNEELKQQATQIAPLQEQLAGATNATSAVASLQEEQKRELARLRNEVSRLHGQTNELAKAKQEIQTLAQRVASEAEARKGAVEEAQAANQKIQAAAQAEAQRMQNNMNACINNLRLIDSAKQQWALEARKQNTDTPTVDDLKPYLGRGPNAQMPACPDGGVYTFGTVGQKPTCSIAGHVLP